MSEQPENEDEVREISDVHEFLDLSDLIAVRTIRVAGELLAHAAQPDPEISEDDPVLGPGMRIFVRRGPRNLEVRCVLTFLSEEVRIVGDVAAIFEHREPLRLDGSVLDYVTQRIGVLAAYPYLREILQSTATRLGVTPPVMGLLHAESIELTDDDDEIGSPSDIPTGLAD